MNALSLPTPTSGLCFRPCRPKSVPFGAHVARPMPVHCLASHNHIAQSPSERVAIEATEPVDAGCSSPRSSASEVFFSSFCLYLLSSGSAIADVVEDPSSSPFTGVQANSLWVTLGLFVLCVPGIWSQVKRAPQAKMVRKTFEVAGPAAPGAMPLDDRARQVFKYFKQYNYDIKQTGEVITFKGVYKADRGQAAAVTFYTFMGLGSIALVLSTAFQSIGGWFYLMTLLSPGAWFYYMSKGTREEEVRVKMLTSDDESTTDIILEGDQEELERFRRELSLAEKGKVYVKGILENA